MIPPSHSLNWFAPDALKQVTCREDRQEEVSLMSIKIIAFNKTTEQKFS